MENLHSESMEALDLLQKTIIASNYSPRSIQAYVREVQIGYPYISAFEKEYFYLIEKVYPKNRGSLLINKAWTQHSIKITDF